MDTPAPNASRPILHHVLLLAALTTLTNTAALAPDMFGGRGAVVPLAVITLLAASGEGLVRSHVRRRHPDAIFSAQGRDLLWMHGWACMLAAIVSVACALTAIL